MDTLSLEVVVVGVETFDLTFVEDTALEFVGGGTIINSI